MENRLNLIITTATAAMLLMPMKTDAQKIASGLISPVSQPKVEQLVKTSPATKKKMEMETRQKYPKLYEGKLLQKKNDYRGLQRFGGRKAMSPLSMSRGCRSERLFLRVESCGEALRLTILGRKTMSFMASTSSMQVTR